MGRESQLEHDRKLYANEVVSKGDVKAALKLLSEATGGIAVFGMAAYALTVWIPGLGIPVSSGIAYMVLKNIGSVYANLPAEDRKLVAKCANFFHRLL